MNIRQERMLERFLLVMFPLTLVVACTTNGDETVANNENRIFNYAEIAHETGMMKTTALPHGSTMDEKTEHNESWSIIKGDNDKYVMVSPSLHLAIYTPSIDDVEDGDSVQVVKYNEKPEFSMPDKYTYRFDSDDYNIASDDLASLKEHAEFLLRNPNFTLTISGHTDHTGSADYNQKLSEQRAQLVADVLSTYGAPTSQLIVDGYGETVPVSQNDLNENRRVELEYSQTLLLSAM